MARIASNDRFHYTAEQYTQLMDNRLAKALSAGIITDDDADLIKAFIESKKGSGQAMSTINKYVNLLVTFRQYMTVPFRAAEKKDLKDAKIAIEGKTNDDGQPAIARNTCRDLMDTAKMFFRWGLDEDEDEVWSQISEPQLKKIKSIRGKIKSKRIEDIMTADEVRRLIDAADNSRDRAMLAIQYECALRAVEIGRLRWRDISQISDRESSITVDEKTDYERHVSIVLYNGYLAQWKRDAKNADDLNGFVFMTHGKNNTGKQVRYDAIYDVIKACAGRAGITGRITSPHTLRHSP